MIERKGNHVPLLIVPGSKQFWSKIFTSADMNRSAHS
jgi:hypothetical protein